MAAISFQATAKISAAGGYAATLEQLVKIDLQDRFEPQVLPHDVPVGFEAGPRQSGLAKTVPQLGDAGWSRGVVVLNQLA